MFCSNCGKQNPDNAKFCDNCGKPIVNAAAPQYSPPPQQQYAPPPPPQYAPPPQPQYAPPPQPVYQQPPPSPFAAPQFPPAEAVISPKSRTTAGLLWFFLGWAGAHRYYMGKIGTGILMLLLFIAGMATYFIGVGIFVLSALSLWLFIDLILILTGKFKDKNGLYIKK
jgi:TM2 domain-containing membrane protein YozV